MNRDTIIDRFLCIGIEHDLTVDDCPTVGKLLETAGDILDDHNSSEIVGRCVFQAADGKFYEGSVEFVINRISKKDALELESQDY